MGQWSRNLRHWVLLQQPHLVHLSPQAGFLTTPPLPALRRTAQPLPPTLTRLLLPPLLDWAGAGTPAAGTRTSLHRGAQQTSGHSPQGWKLHGTLGRGLSGWAGLLPIPSSCLTSVAGRLQPLGFISLLYVRAAVCRKRWCLAGFADHQVTCWSSNWKGGISISGAHVRYKMICRQLWQVHWPQESATLGSKLNHHSWEKDNRICRASYFNTFNSIFSLFFE